MKEKWIAGENRALKKALAATMANRTFAAYGDALVSARQFSYPHFETFTLPEDIDWTVNPFANRTWQWRLNQLCFLSHLVAFHAQSESDKALDMALEFISSWWQRWQNTEPGEDFEFAWHDHGTALRVEQILLFAYYVQEKASAWADSNSSSLEFLLPMLKRHGEFLNREDFYSRNSNHGLEQARVLLLLGTCLGGEDGAKWCGTALERIAGEYDAAFTHEGAHKENSPAYHNFVLNVFMAILDNYPDELGVLREKFMTGIHKNLEFITHILRPDGKFPILGDTEQRAPSDAFRGVLGNTKEYGHFLYATTQGRNGQRPDSNRLCLPKSGYAVFRDNWHENSDWNNTIQLTIKGGSVGGWHYHQDEGSILLYAFGEDWLIDSGMYSFNQGDSIRRYMRSRRAHNVPMVDDAIYEPHSGALFTGWQMSFSESTECHETCMRMDIFKNMSLVREVLIAKKDFSFIVRDYFHFKDEKTHGVSLNWHIPLDKKIFMDGQSARICSEKCLKLDCQGVESLYLARGRRKDKIFSLVSTDRFVSSDSQCLIARCNVADGAVIESRFQFEK